jgi:hypothetical protein
MRPGWRDVIGGAGRQFPIVGGFHIGNKDVAITIESRMKRNVLPVRRPPRKTGYLAWRRVS